MTHTPNYAEQLEAEAYALSRKKLIRLAERFGGDDRLDGWLARLDLIHIRNMDLAREWAPPPHRSGPPLVATNVSDSVVTGTAIGLVSEARENTDA